MSHVHLRIPRIPRPTPAETEIAFYVNITDRMDRPAILERPDGLTIIAHLRRGSRSPEIIDCTFPLLAPHEQWPWRAGFHLPPYPADPLDYLPGYLVADWAAVPPRLALPPEYRVG